MPFLAIAVDQTVPAASDWLAFAAEQIGLGTLIGVAVGGGGRGSSSAQRSAA